MILARTVDGEVRSVQAPPEAIPELVRAWLDSDEEPWRAYKTAGLYLTTKPAVFLYSSEGERRIQIIWSFMRNDAWCTTITKEEALSPAFWTAIESLMATRGVY